MDEQRNRMRQNLKKLAFAKNTRGARGGLLRDISSHGAGVVFVNPLGTAEHMFEIDDQLELTIDDFQVLKGQVVRTDPTGIYVAFDLDDAEEKVLIAEIMMAVNEIKPEKA